MGIKVTARCGNAHYRLDLSPAQVRKYDNGALISCGLTIPDDMPIRALNWLVRHKRAHVISAETANHSGCQSYCILRGDDHCQW